MAIGTTNLAATPCCGLIQRTWEGWDSNRQEAVEPPDFAKELYQLSIGKCPDCQRFFLQWLLQNGGRETKDGWRWDYGAAERAYVAGV